MSRPSNPSLKEVWDDDSQQTWTITESPQFYVLTYQNKIVTIRHENTYTVGVKCKKYDRTMLSNEASIKQAVKKYNRIFNTEDFSYIKIQGTNNEIK